MKKQWVHKPQAEPALVAELSEALNINQTLSAILLQRGVRTFDEAKAYFRPSPQQLHDPFLMKDMDKAVKRLQQGLLRKEKILVYGDYDVDGTTSVALVYGFLSQFHDRLDYYIPDRYKEGYGISEEGIRWAHEQGFSLIVCLDCGTKALDRVRQAKELGIDFIICDHHMPGDELPEAVALLNPKRPGCPYPFKELSACGVGFKFIQAYCEAHDIPRHKLYRYLDLVVVSIASDIVPLVDENRTLAYLGLEKLNTKPCPGLTALIEGRKNSRERLSISSIVFGVGPRINSSGRIAHARSSVDLLLAEDLPTARELARIINKKNELRKNFDSTITQEALSMIENDVHNQAAKTTVLYKKDWHKGVIGIVASRCIEKYYRPTIILTYSNDFVTGSARSVEGFDIYRAVSACSDLLEQFGGHPFAAGLTLKHDNLPAFRYRFEQVVRELMPEQPLVPELKIDQKINFDQIGPNFFNILRQMEPFGPQNMRPVFMSENVQVVGWPKILKEKHLRLQLRQQGNDQVFDAIAFSMAPHFKAFSSGKKFKIAYSIEENNYVMPDALQLNIKDIQF